MLRLKKVSKFYYNKGIVASGINNVSLNFELGEFVVITGESGSGKSTLLNVISGLDSYEEGEMYINDLETSHYRESDFEDYRKKYVSNIFQTYNLVNSYSVYQNIELVFLINGYKSKDIKSKVLSLIEEVGLTKYKNTKVSKLSGGQKQRVAIARALAKETPIIIADEPTGNLDSKSGREIVKLLKKVSNGKLVIVVTHNLEQILHLATRVITMADGRVISDNKIKEYDKCNSEIEFNDNKMSIFNIVKLGIRNTFNIIPKFLLILMVFLFISFGLLSMYSSSEKSEVDSINSLYNNYFSNTDPKRIVINKKDGTKFTEEDVSNISNISNVDYIVKNDVLLDRTVYANTNDDDNLYIYGYLRNIDSFKDSVDVGRLPNSDDEVVIVINEEYNYQFDEYKDDMDKLFNKNFVIEDNKDFKFKIVGIKYDNNTFDDYIYVSNNYIDKYMYNYNREISKTKVMINNKYLNDDVSFIGKSNSISEGHAVINENYEYLCKNYNCKNNKVYITVKNLYYEKELELVIDKSYNEKTRYDDWYSEIYISSVDYDKLFNECDYQYSIFVDDIRNIDVVDNELLNLGFNTLKIKDTNINAESDLLKVFAIVKVVINIVLIVTLFFISYFVIKLILKSRNVYYTTLRILGSNVSNTKRILDVELFTNATFTYLIVIGFVLLCKYNVINNSYISSLISYLEMKDYLIVYLIIVIMSYAISTRFARKIFKRSVMKTYKEEV